MVDVDNSRAVYREEGVREEPVELLHLFFYKTNIIKWNDYQYPILIFWINDLLDDPFQMFESDEWVPSMPHHAFTESSQHT